jgi:hypothetical protein
LSSSLEVRTATAFGELIIAIVYLPILTLEGDRGEDVPADGAHGRLRARDVRSSYPSR